MSIDRFIRWSIPASCVFLTACGLSTTPLLAGPNPLVVAACPPLSPLAPEQDTFGDTTLKLVEVAGQYRKCRAAALGRDDTPSVESERTTKE